MTNLKKIPFLVTFLVAVNSLAQETKPVANIPFVLKGNHIFVQLTVNHSEQLDFIFDTGAGATVISSETATRLNFASSKTSNTTGASGEAQSSIIKDKSIKIGSIELDKIKLLSIPLSHLERSIGKNIDGIIGFDLL